MSSQHALVRVYLSTGQRNVIGACLLNGVIYFVEWPKLCNFGTKVGNTTPVGQYPKGASSYICLDMADNF